MLLLHRKSGQGVTLNNEVDNEVIKIDYMYTRSGVVHARINDEEVTHRISKMFYLGKREDVKALFIYKDSSLRIAIEAPKLWNIRRNEVKPDQNKTKA